MVSASPPASAPDRPRPVSLSDLFVSFTWLALQGFGGDWPLRLFAIVSGLVIWRTRLHLLWLLAAGALLGAFGFV